MHTLAAVLCHTRDIDFKWKCAIFVFIEFCIIFRCCCRPITRTPGVWWLKPTSRICHKNGSPLPSPHLSAKGNRQINENVGNALTLGANTMPKCHYTFSLHFNCHNGRHVSDMCRITQKGRKRVMPPKATKAIVSLRNNSYTLSLSPSLLIFHLCCRWMDPFIVHSSCTD